MFSRRNSLVAGLFVLVFGLSLGLAAPSAHAGVGEWTEWHEFRSSRDGQLLLLDYRVRRITGDYGGEGSYYQIELINRKLDTTAHGHFRIDGKRFTYGGLSQNATDSWNFRLQPGESTVFTSTMDVLDSAAVRNVGWD